MQIQNEAMLKVKTMCRINVVAHLPPLCLFNQKYT